MLLFPLLCIWLCISAATHRQTCNTAACLSWLNYCNMLTSLYIGYIWRRRQRYYSPSVSRLQSSAVISAALITLRRLRWLAEVYGDVLERFDSEVVIQERKEARFLFSWTLLQHKYFQYIWRRNVDCCCLPGCHVTCNHFSRHIKQISHYLSSM